MYTYVTRMCVCVFFVCVFCVLYVCERVVVFMAFFFFS